MKLRRANVHFAVERRLQRRVDSAFRDAFQVDLAQRHMNHVEAVVPGTRSMSPVRPNPASTPWASSSVPLLMYVSTPGSGSVPNALAHKATAVRFQLLGYIADHQHFDFTPLRRHGREIVVEHIDAGRGGEIAEVGHAVG